MIPLWLFTLGAKFEDDKISLTVPFGKIFLTLCVIIIPLFIGAAIKKWLPKAAKVRAGFLLLLLFVCLFAFYNCLAPMGFLPWENRVAFPGKI